MILSQQFKNQCETKRSSVTKHRIQGECQNALIQETIQYKRKCSDWNSKRKLIAILINNRHIGYKTSSKYGLSSRVSCKSKTLRGWGKMQCDLFLNEPFTKFRLPLLQALSVSERYNLKLSQNFQILTFWFSKDGFVTLIICYFLVRLYPTNFSMWWIHNEINSKFNQSICSMAVLVITMKKLYSKSWNQAKSSIQKFCKKNCWYKIKNFIVYNEFYFQ